MGTYRQNMGFKEYRLETFGRICPPLYCHTDESRLADVSREVLAMPYPKNGRGVLLTGESRTGKTRTAWMLARNWYCSKDVSLLWYNGGSFSRAMADKYGDGKAESWHEDLKRAGILLLDDIFKARLTEAVQDALFSVVEDRMAYMLPTILTLNNDAGGLSSALSPDLVVPMVERLKESSDVFVFDKRLKG